MPRTCLTRHAEIEPYVSRDGSVIRELMHPALHGGHNQSLAEATLLPGARTLLHRHLRTEEIYHVLAGRAEMTLGEAVFAIGPGDTVLIPPGTAHCLRNLDAVPLRILCACAPAYSHEDTELIEDA